MAPPAQKPVIRHHQEAFTGAFSVFACAREGRGKRWSSCQELRGGMGVRTGETDASGRVDATGVRSRRQQAEKGKVA